MILSKFDLIPKERGFKNFWNMKQYNTVGTYDKIILRLLVHKQK